MSVASGDGGACRAGVTALAVQAGCVGAARAAGVEAAASWAATLAPGRLWVANTDADSTVPLRWLVNQVGFATEGHDLVVGTVQPVAGDLHPTSWTRGGTGTA